MTPNLADIVELLRSFKVYYYTIYFFVIRPYIALNLYNALVRYRIRLIDFSLIYRFNLVRVYYYTFIGDRILKG